MTGINLNIKSKTDGTTNTYGILFAEVNGAYISQVLNEGLNIIWNDIKTEKELSVERLTTFLNSLGDVTEVSPHPSDDFVIDSIKKLKI